jgi:hypothetical protein
VACLWFGTFSVEIMSGNLLTNLKRMKGYFSPHISSYAFTTDIAENRFLQPAATVAKSTKQLVTQN